MRFERMKNMRARIGNGGLGEDGFGGGRHGGFARRHGRRGRRGPRGKFGADELRLLILKLVKEEPSHGYDLIRRIEELTGGAYAPSPGMIYPALSMLEDMGLVQAEQADGARKTFSITEDGEAEMAENQEKLAELQARIAQFAERHARIDAAPIKRAMGNLATALRGRMSREDAKQEMALDIADLLDDVARKIERM